MTGAWALNALDAEERARIEGYLAQDADAAAEARSFEETAGELARGLEPVAPRPELKNSLLARISQTSQLPPHPAENADEAADAAAGSRDEVAARRESSPRTHRADYPVADDSAADRPTGDPDPTEHDAAVVPLDRYRSSVQRTRWLAVAAAALMVTTVTGIGLWGTERSAQEKSQATIEALESQQAVSVQERELIATIMASGDAAQLTLPSDDGGSLNLLYSTEQEAMLVQTAGLPELPSDSTYQLWLIDPGADPASAGLLTDPDKSALVEGSMTPETTLALSVEPAGGSEQPTTTPIVQGLLS